MYHDLMLKFADEGEAYTALFDTTIAEDGTVTLTQKYLAVDIIGTIYKPTPVDAPEDYVPEAYSGFHVNVRHSGEAPELDQFVVTPSPVTPLRVWA